jgi:malate dehydrogenase (quinone)
MQQPLDVLIIGAGISGCARAFALSYTSVQRVGLLEKYDAVAQVNSNTFANSQTLHEALLESQYSPSKAIEVHMRAAWTKKYLERFDAAHRFHSHYGQMLLAVGDKEIMQLQAHFAKIQPIFGDTAQYLNREQIAIIEPKVVEGRNPREPIAAVYCPQGVTVDYNLLAKSLLQQAQARKPIEAYFEREVTTIEKTDFGYRVHTSKGPIDTKVLLDCSGAHALLHAQQLGIGLEYTILPVHGSFAFCTKEDLVRNKIYTMQEPSVPFANMHVDPDVHNPRLSRFGPTASMSPFLERDNAETFKSYMQTHPLQWGAGVAIANMLAGKPQLKFALTNALYLVPGVGKYVFAHSARKLIPTMRAADLAFNARSGGTRPQLVNVKTRKIELGTGKFEDGRAIFNLTPSPGATTAISDSFGDARKAVAMLQADGLGYAVDDASLEKDFTSV